MSFELARKYAPHVDELFRSESKISLLTNSNYDWTGAHSVMVYKFNTAPMNDYVRNKTLAETPEQSISRFGKILDLEAQTEELLLKKDRSFIFNIDKLDQDETNDALKAATALARQIREEVIPEVDTYVYTAMATGAGTKASPAALTGENVYSAIIAGSEALDNAEVPDTERVLVVSPATYRAMKSAKEIDLSMDVPQELRSLGVIGIVDGMMVVKVPAVRLPENFGFMLAHPSATVAPVKLEDYGTHPNTVLSSGTIVTGRIAYDAFVLANKKTGIYYHPVL